MSSVWWIKTDRLPSHCDAGIGESFPNLHSITGMPHRPRVSDQHYFPGRCSLDLSEGTLTPTRIKPYLHVALAMALLTKTRKSKVKMMSPNVQVKMKTSSSTCAPRRGGMHVTSTAEPQARCSKMHTPHQAGRYRGGAPRLETLSLTVSGIDSELRTYSVFNFLGDNNRSCPMGLGLRPLLPSLRFSHDALTA